jgi:hypothetical protein
MKPFALVATAAALVAALLMGPSGIAAAVPDAECTVEKQKKPGEDCVQCEGDACKGLDVQGYMPRCMAGKVEVWCKTVEGPGTDE